MPPATDTSDWEKNFVACAHNGLIGLTSALRLAREVIEREGALAFNDGVMFGRASALKEVVETVEGMQIMCADTHSAIARNNVLQDILTHLKQSITKLTEKEA